MEWYWLLVILVTHYIADFWVQTHEQSIKKSSSLEYLTLHIVTYTLCWLPLIITIVSINMSDLGLNIWNGGESDGTGYFFGYTYTAIAMVFAGHWITDFVTSKAAKLEFSKPDGEGIRTGFQIVGFDQMIHYTHLYLVFYWLTNL